MRYLLLLLLLLLVIAVIIARRKKEPTKKTIPPTPIPIYPDISQRDFTVLAKQAAKKIKRINYLRVEGAKVYGYVNSQSGISEWGFKLDFGRIDQLTGQYTKYSDNKDSEIPGIVAKAIRAEILAYPNMTLDRGSYYAFCPHCGRRLHGKPGKFCSLCGAQLTQES